MNLRILICLLGASLAAIGCNVETDTEATMEDAREAIEQLHESHVQAALGEDVEAFLATVTADFRLMPPNDPGAQGKEATRTWFNATFGSFRIAALDFPTTEVSVDHDLAFRHYTYDWTLEPKAGGDSIRDRGNRLYVYRRESDGSWKVAYDIWTSSEPIPASE